MRSSFAPLYRRLVRLHAPLLVATAGAAFLFELFMVWISAQLDSGAGLQAMIAQLLPPEVQQVIFEQFGMGSFQGTVAFGFRHPIFLVAILSFIVVAASVPAAERETGFMDLVLARPVRRSAYLAAALALVITGAVLLPMAVLAGAAAGLATVDAVPEGLAWTTYAPAAAAQGLLLLAAGGIGLLAAASAGRRGLAVGRAVGLLLVFYWLDVVGPFWDVLETAHWISLFSYFEPSAAVSAGLRPRDAAVLLAVFFITSAAAFWEFRRQDL